MNADHKSPIERIKNRIKVLEADKRSLENKRDSISIKDDKWMEKTRVIFIDLAEIGIKIGTLKWVLELLVSELLEDER